MLASNVPFLSILYSNSSPNDTNYNVKMTRSRVSLRSSRANSPSGSDEDDGSDEAKSPKSESGEAPRGRTRKQALSEEDAMEA